MATPDLPIELWLEVLRYLPRSALRKMIGVNRILFELALDDLYSEVRFIDDDKDTTKMFAQLSYSNISKRVRHLFIRPSFLPAMDRDLSRDSETLEHTLSTMLVSIKNGIKRATSTSSASKEDPSDPSAGILKAAGKAVKACRNLRDISLVVHDHTLTPLFTLFLNSLWASDSVGPCLHSLSLDTTVLKLPLLLNPLVKRAAALPNLVALDINISISRFPQSDAYWQTAGNALVNFLKTFAGSLTSFTFSSLVSCDVNVLFGSFPKLPKLVSFEFRSVFNTDTFPNAEDFTRFIRRHAQTLTTLVIKPRARSATTSSSDDSYSVWLHHPPALQTKERFYSLTQLVLPNLRTLDVGLREVWGISTPDDQSRSTTFGFLPDLTRVTPSLTRLVITDAKLATERVMALLDMLGAQDGGSPLEALVFATHTVQPQLFDRLAQALPRLRALTIDCTCYRTEEGLRSSWNDFQNAVAFAEAMHARTYPRWELRYLRLGSMYHCGASHPNNDMMKSVAESLSSSDVVLDTELRCDCVENINYMSPNALATESSADLGYGYGYSSRYEPYI